MTAEQVNDQLTAQAMDRWNLEILYKGLDDPQFKADYAKFQDTMSRAEAHLPRLIESKEPEVIVEGIALLEELATLSEKLGAYPSLLQSADTRNSEYASVLNKLMMDATRMEAYQVVFLQKVRDIEDLEQFSRDHNLEHYRFALQEAKKDASFKLERQLEELAAKLNISGGSAWSQLRSYLTATLEVDWEGKATTLSDIRNLAYEADRDVRRRAYEAELASYSKIDSSLAFALNSIKSQVTLLARERGYTSPLDEALHASRLDQATLDTMLDVMQKHFPDFRRYLKAKAKLVNGSDKLPWYDLFAPVGKVEDKYTIAESRDYLLDVFTPLSADIAEVMRRAYDEQWIDFLPRQGKVGGAFCANLPSVKQSRVLTNFDGSYNSLSTLAHELGHAYHGYCIDDHAPLNRNYSMPVAETASTFNETHLTLQAVAKTEDPQARLAVLEGFLSGTTQTIVDIFSRFLFEKEVFERCENEFLNSAALQEIMLRAQDATYGDALDETLRHPFMWACKGHYYSPGLSYYNFPYAFGALFSMGLYNMYREEGQSFMDKYADMLHTTTIASCEDVAATVGVDLRQADFWESSMSAFVEMIDLYSSIVDEVTAEA